MIYPWISITTFANKNLLYNDSKTYYDGLLFKQITQANDEGDGDDDDDGDDGDNDVMVVIRH